MSGLAGIGAMVCAICSAMVGKERLIAGRGWSVCSGFESFEVIVSVRRSSNFSLRVATRAT